MGGQDKVSQFEDDGLPGHEDSSPALDGQTLEDMQASAQLLAMQAVLDELEDEEDHVVYTLKYPLAPLKNGKGDKFAPLKKLKFPKVLRGEHICRVILIGEMRQTGEVGQLESDMSRIPAYTGVPVEAVKRMHHRDVAALIVVAREVASGKYEAS